MDIESRLQKMEAQVHQTWIIMWILLFLVVTLCLDLLPTGDLHTILVGFGLVAVAYLLVSAASGLRQFRASRAAEAQLQERILRDFIAERAKARGRDPGP